MLGIEVSDHEIIKGEKISHADKKNTIEENSGGKDA